MLAMGRIFGPAFRTRIQVAGLNNGSIFFQELQILQKGLVERPGMRLGIKRHIHKQIIMWAMF